MKGHKTVTYIIVEGYEYLRRCSEGSGVASKEKTWGIMQVIFMYAPGKHTILVKLEL